MACRKIAQQLLAQVRFRELNTAAAQPLHEPREWNVTRIQKQMHMVQHQNRHGREKHTLLSNYALSLDTSFDLDHRRKSFAVDFLGRLHDRRPLDIRPCCPLPANSEGRPPRVDPHLSWFISSTARNRRGSMQSSTIFSSTELDGRNELYPRNWRCGYLVEGEVSLLSQLKIVLRHACECIGRGLQESFRPRAPCLLRRDYGTFSGLSEVHHPLYR